MLTKKVQNVGLLSTGREASKHATSVQIFQRWNLTLTLTIWHILCMSGLEVRIHYLFLPTNFREPGGGGYVTSPNIVYLGGNHWLGAEAVKQHMEILNTFIKCDTQ